MQRIFIMAVMVAFAASLLVACGAGGPDKKVYSDWVDATIAAVKEGKTDFDAQAKGDELAKEAGFEGWNDYITKLAQSMGADEYSKFTTAEGERMQKAMTEATEAGASEAGEGEAGEGEGDEAGEEESAE